MKKNNVILGFFILTIFSSLSSFQIKNVVAIELGDGIELPASVGDTITYNITNGGIGGPYEGQKLVITYGNLNTSGSEIYIKCKADIINRTSGAIITNIVTDVNVMGYNTSSDKLLVPYNLPGTDQGVIGLIPPGFNLTHIGMELTTGSSPFDVFSIVGDTLNITDYPIVSGPISILIKMDEDGFVTELTRTLDNIPNWAVSFESTTIIIDNTSNYELPGYDIFLIMGMIGLFSLIVIKINHKKLKK